MYVVVRKRRKKSPTLFYYHIVTELREVPLGWGSWLLSENNAIFEIWVVYILIKCTTFQFLNGNTRFWHFIWDPWIEVHMKSRQFMHFPWNLHKVRRNQSLRMMLKPRENTHLFFSKIIRFKCFFFNQIHWINGPKHNNLSILLNLKTYFNSENT